MTGEHQDHDQDQDRSTASHLQTADSRLQPPGVVVLRTRALHMDRSTMLGRGAPCLLVDMARRSPRNACVRACVRDGLSVARCLSLVAFVVCCSLPGGPRAGTGETSRMMLFLLAVST